VASQPVRPIYFTKLTLENIRSFSERQELTLDDDGRPARWTLIVGDNGVGKTTLLQCLARMCPVFNKPSDDGTDPEPAPVEPELAGEENNDVLNAFARSGEDTKATLQAEFSLDVQLDGQAARQAGAISTKLDITRSSGHFTGFKSDGGPAEIVGKHPDLDGPLILAYGAGRHPKVGDVEKSVGTGSVDSLFEVESALHDAEELLYRLDYGSMKGDNTEEMRLASMKWMLSEILPDVDRPENIEIYVPPTSAPSGKPRGVWITTDYGKVPLGQLSLGYQTVFAWTLDIAWRLLERYPDSPNPLREPAVVIVDEIDLHLHPRWQRDIREHLIGHFPNTQFIATAHSPLMAQCSLGANLAVLHKTGDHAEILNDPAIIREWRLDQVVTSELFGLNSSRPPEVEKLIERRRVLAERTELTVSEQLELENLDEKVDALPTAESTEDQRAMEIIRLAAETLTSNGHV